MGARFFLQKHFPDSVTFGTERPAVAVLYFPPVMNKNRFNNLWWRNLALKAW